MKHKSFSFFYIITAGHQRTDIGTRGVIRLYYLLDPSIKGKKVYKQHTKVPFSTLKAPKNLTSFTVHLHSNFCNQMNPVNSDKSAGLETVQNKRH